MISKTVHATLSSWRVTTDETDPSQAWTLLGSAGWSCACYPRITGLRWAPFMATGEPRPATHPWHLDRKQNMINELSAFPNHFFPAWGLITNRIATLRQKGRVEMSFACRQDPRPWGTHDTSPLMQSKAICSAHHPSFLISMRGIGCGGTSVSFNQVISCVAVEEKVMRWWHVWRATCV